MSGSMLGPVAPSKHFRSSKQQQPPRVAACHLWATGQFSTYQLDKQSRTVPARLSSGTGLKQVAPLNVSPTPSTGLTTPTVAAPAVRKAETSSTTSAPLFPDEILDNLYISDLETARAVLSPNYAAPGRPNIKYILTVLKDEKKAPTVADDDRRSKFILKRIKVGDYPDVNLLQHLPDAIGFIKDALARNDGGVLVHCRKGMSRSGSIMVACVMELLKLDFCDALAFCVKKRSKILPNDGFQSQLRLWMDMSFSLVDADGQEKEQYVAWKQNKVFRDVSSHTLML